MTGRALLSRLAEQRKSICHREHAKRQSAKVRENKRDTQQRKGKQGIGEQTEKELAESSFCLLSHPLTVFPSSLPGRGKGKKKKSAGRERRRGSSATLAL